MGRACSRHGREYECIQDFDGKSRMRETLVRPRRRWEVNIMTDLRDVRGGDIVWIQLA
jgi:hypothetical protein